MSFDGPYVRGLWEYIHRWLEINISDVLKLEKEDTSIILGIEENHVFISYSHKMFLQKNLAYSTEASCLSSVYE